MHKLQRLYNSEINFSITTFWDEGFDWKLGDEINGFKATGCADTFKEAVNDLCDAAKEFFPASYFASKRTRNTTSRSWSVYHLEDKW
jgi:hypothetical protein